MRNNQPTHGRQVPLRRPAGLHTLRPPANLGVRSDDLLARLAGREQRIAKLEKALNGTLQVVSKVGA